MKHISDLLNTASLSVEREERKESIEAIPLDPHVTDVVNRLFTLFYALCRGFDKQYQDPKRLNLEKTQWIRTFMKIEFNTLEKVRHGIEKFRLESPINTPTVGQFIKWCTPTAEDLGLLSKEQAFNRSAEFLREGWLNDLSDDQNLLLQHAINESDSYFLKNNTMRKTQPVFYRNYEIAIRDFFSGKLKPIPKGIENKEIETRELYKQDDIAKNYKNCNSHRSAIQAMKRMLGGSNFNVG